MRTIAIITLKGGTAKTTTTRNMAHILATDYNKKVLVIDLDSSGNLSASFRLRPEKTPGGEAELYGGAKMLASTDANTRDFILHTETPGIDIIPTNDSMKQADTFLRATSSPQPFRLSKQLRQVKDDYDYCLLDCPPHEDLVVFNALVAAQEVISPSTIGQDSMDGVVRVAAWIERELNDYNPGLVFRGVLKTCIRNNKVDKEGVECPIIMPHTGRALPQFTTYIRHSVDAERSRFMNCAMKEFSPRTAPAIDYDNFVAEYLSLPPKHTKGVPYAQA